MQIEVVQLSKVEKSTDKGIVNVHKATLKGLDFVKSPESGHSVAVAAKLTLECEEDGSALEQFIAREIGDIRILNVLPVNKRLDGFAEVEALKA